MTLLPIESWNVKPRLDLPAYALNSVCPVTGETGERLEDHHIFRRSFTALGKEENESLYWVEWVDEGVLLPNRVALAPEAHQRLTANVSRLEYRDGRWFYVEGGESRDLDLRFALVAGVEKPRRAPRTKTEKPRQRSVVSIRVPQDAQEDGAEILYGYLDAARARYSEERGWSETVPNYQPLEAALYDWHRVFVLGETP